MTAHRLRRIDAARHRLALVVPAALAAGIGAAALMAAAPRDPAGGAEVAVALLVGWSFVASGLVAWQERPENPIGKIMVATGFAWFAHELSWAQDALPWTLGQLFEPTYLLGAGYLLTTFPEGRVRTRLQRSIFAAALLIVGPLQLGWMLLGYGDDRPCGGCPATCCASPTRPRCPRRSSTCSRRSGSGSPAR